MTEEISFGIWLRKQRRALDFTRQAFADQVGCAEVTLRRIEAGTLKPSKELASILLEKLGISETEWPQWISFARGLSRFPLSSTSPSKKPSRNLPAPLTTFIGREKEQVEVIKLIAQHRLVTLTGSGGVGKTRLSIRVGEQVIGNYADGVWFIELAPIRDPLLLPRITAIAIGLRDEPQRPVIDMLSDYLREKRMLIILDNCEHLLDACAQLADTLLKRCPDLKILATSREALGVLGEAVYTVPSLELPDLQQLVEKFRGYESVRLFEERAQLAKMDFSLTIENVTWVAKICSRLDGIPLAIELAAARIKMLSTEQIAERLQESFSLLTIGNRSALPRHKTLRAAIDWSYDLLLPAEKAVFRRLSVFVNGWTLEAAQSICSDSNITAEDILDLLAQLTNKSLLIAKNLPIGIRYHMLETIRQYANEKLIEAGESEALRDRHLEYFLNLAETAEPHLIRPEQIEWLPLLDADYENLRLALEWALSKESAEPALNFCKDLWWFWMYRSYWLEGMKYVKSALAKSFQPESMNEKAARAKALYICASFDVVLDNPAEQRLLSAKESLALALEVSDKRDIAIARFHVGAALMFHGGDDNQALSLMEQSLSELQVLKESFWQADCFPAFGNLLVKQGKLKPQDFNLRSLELAYTAGERINLSDALIGYAHWLYNANRIDEAKEYMQEAESVSKQIGLDNTSFNTSLFAQIAWCNGDYQKAELLFRDILERFSSLGAKGGKAECTEMLGLLAIEQGDLHRAQLYLQQALELLQETEYKPMIAWGLTELSNLYYLRGNLDDFKRKFREALSLKTHFTKAAKYFILMTILGSLHFQKPEISSQLLGAIGNDEGQFEFHFTPIDKRYCRRAEAHAREVLGDEGFEAAFAEGQKMSLDEGLDLALKTVEEM